MTDEDSDFFYRGFRMEVGWRPRRETPVDIARRWLTTIDRLRTIHAIFDKLWDWTDFSAIEPLSSSVDEVAMKIAAETEREANEYDGQSLHDIVNGRSVPVFQYVVRARNAPADFEWGPRGVKLEAWCGSGASFLDHKIDFETDMCFTPDPDLVTWETARAILLALTDEFDAEYGVAFPLAIWRDSDLRYDPDPPLLKPAWLSYLGAQLAPLIEPPSSAVIERRSNGSLLMAATAESFDAENPIHRVVSAEIAVAAGGLRWSHRLGL